MDVINHRGSRQSRKLRENEDDRACDRAHSKARLSPKCIVAAAFLARFLSAAYGAEVADLPNPANSGDATEYQRNWPGDHPALYKLNKSLILAIPPQYQKFWIQGGSVLRDRKQLEQAPDTQIVGFSFFLPDYSGYTANNFQQDFDTSRVDVVSIEPANPRQADPGAPGFWPPNMIKRVLKVGIVGEPFDRYGLRCYHTVVAPKSPVTCYGVSDAGHGEDILLEVFLPPYSNDYITLPLMQAVYFTKRYGGLQLIWRTSADNFSHWREINLKIWNFVETWNISKQHDHSK
jgi:hypothetical protein